MKKEIKIGNKDGVVFSASLDITEYPMLSNIRFTSPGGNVVEMSASHRGIASDLKDLAHKIEEEVQREVKLNQPLKNGDVFKTIFSEYRRIVSTSNQENFWLTVDCNLDGSIKIGGRVSLLRKDLVNTRADLDAWEFIKNVL